jgi:hypothetical protein
MLNQIQSLTNQLFLLEDKLKADIKKDVSFPEIEDVSGTINALNNGTAYLKQQHTKHNP